MKKILILNGPNINLIGYRETNIYGKKTFKYLCYNIRKIFYKEIKLSFFQSNNEKKLIKKLHKEKNYIKGIIINPGAYSYYSIAILDAIIATNKIFIEVHISNIHNRDKWRDKSIFSKYAKAVITGMGIYGYIYAIHTILNL